MSNVEQQCHRPGRSKAGLPTDAVYSLACVLG